MTPQSFEHLADVELRHWWSVARRAILRQALECVLPTHANKLIVDVGCGTGANIAALAQDGAYECLGIDASADAIRFARARFPNVRFIHGLAPHDLGDAAGRADAFLLMDVLEHVEDDAAVLGPIVAAAKPGAHFIITVPADMRLWSAHDIGLHHYRRYEPELLRAAWQGLPVEEIALTHFCSRLYPVARAARLASRVRERIRPKRAWDMNVPPAPVNALFRRIFAGEAQRLVDLIRGRRTSGYAHGVSLLAVLRT